MLGVTYLQGHQMFFKNHMLCFEHRGTCPSSCHIMTGRSEGNCLGIT